MLVEIPVFANLSPEYLKALEEITQEIFLDKGAQLFAPGDPSRGFYVVRDGAVRI
jgi:CRP-like cAMP-binding protein